MPEAVQSRLGEAEDPETDLPTATIVDPHLTATPTETEEEEVQEVEAEVADHQGRTVLEVPEIHRYPLPTITMEGTQTEITPVAETLPGAEEDHQTVAVTVEEMIHHPRHPVRHPPIPRKKTKKKFLDTNLAQKARNSELLLWLHPVRPSFFRTG